MTNTKKYRTLEAYFEDWPEGRLSDHEFIWYVNRRLTMDEWIKLDDEMGEAFERAGISLDDVVGVAGPIPFPDAGQQGAEPHL